MASGGAPLPTYEQTTVAAEYYQKTQNTPSLGINKPYLKSIPGVLKITEMIINLIVIICTSANAYYATSFGGGWTDFVSVTSLIIGIVLFIFYLTNLIFKLPGPWPLILFVYFAGTTVCYLIAFICSAAATQHGSAVVAAAIFAFIALVLYGVETFFYFKAWRANSLFVAYYPPVEQQAQQQQPTNGPQSPDYAEPPPQY